MWALDNIHESTYAGFPSSTKRQLQNEASPVSGMPCARCMREFSTSLAETKKIRLGAWSRSTTFSSSTRKFTQRSVCCFLTYGKKGHNFKVHYSLKFSKKKNFFKLPLWFLAKQIVLLLCSKDNIKPNNSKLCWQLTHILHVFRFVSWGVPAVVEDKDVGLWQPFIHFVKKVLFLNG